MHVSSPEVCQNCLIPGRTGIFEHRGVPQTHLRQGHEDRTQARATTEGLQPYITREQEETREVFHQNLKGLALASKE